MTKSEFTKQYMFGCEPVSDWKVGSSLDWRGATNGVIYVKGRILKILPGRLLVYTTFNSNASDHYSDIPANYLTVSLRLSEQNPGHTELLVRQGDFRRVAAGERRYNDSSRNWNTVLPKIEELSESTRSA